jgi:hypothetical protein
MKKALIPAAILLTLAGAAHAEMSIYGLIDLSLGRNGIDNTNEPAAGFHSGGDGVQGNSSSRVGIKGSNEVAPGYKVNFDLQTSGITSTGDVGSTDFDKKTKTPFFGRQAWAGLSGGFGEVRIGRQDYVAFQTMIDFDLNGAANAASAFGHSGVAVWNATTPTSRQDGSLQYIGKFGGFKVQVGVQPSTDAQVDYGAKGTSTVGKGNGALGVTYTDGKIAVAGTYQSKLVEGGEDFAAVAASYDFGVLKGVVGYADASDTAKGVNLGVVAPVAGFNVGLQFAANTKGDKAKGTEFFVNREVMKNTTVYLDVGTKKATSTDTTKAFALGAIYTF